MDKEEGRKRLRFIPFRRRDIVLMCLAEGRLAGREEEFKRLCAMMGSIFHFEFHKITERFKELYAPVDPDSDTRLPAGAKEEGRADFIDLLGGLLEKANYERISQEDLNQALKSSSLFKIRLHVDFEDFSEALLFCRGESEREEILPRFWGLSKQAISFINYDRVVVYIRFREDFDQGKSAFPLCRPGATLLKLFQNVPKADLEMLFPNTRVGMRTMDKLLIGVPAVVSGGIVLTTKLGASLVLMGSLLGFWLGLSSQPVELNKTTLLALMAGLAALGGYLWKQFSQFKNRKLTFMQKLTQNLYFKNLDNNAGVVHRIVDDAEEEEGKEAILAYYFLLAKAEPMAREELDRAVEAFLAEKHDCEIDFEIDDALDKLLDLGLVSESGGKLTAEPIDEGIKKLDRRWDDYFLPAGER